MRTACTQGKHICGAKRTPKVRESLVYKQEERNTADWYTVLVKRMAKLLAAYPRNCPRSAFYTMFGNITLI